MSGKYTNTLMLNGFIIMKPKTITNARGVKSSSFILHQISANYTGEVIDKTFSVMVYVPAVVEELEKMTNVSFVTCFCSLEWNRKLKMNYAQAYNIEVSSLVGEELEESYNKETYFKELKDE